MPNPLFEAGLQALTFSRRSLLGMIDDVPKDKLCYQPFPGANHVLWILGHLANADDFFMVELGKKTCPKFEESKGVFFMGSKPEPTPAKYPSLEDVKDYAATSREALIGWFRSMNDAQLAAALPDDWKSFAPTFGALMFTIAWHEGMHTGQLTVIRKSLGIPAKFA